MTTFNLIIKKIINLDNNIFSYNYDRKDTVEGIYKIFFYSLYSDTNNKFYKNKFYFISEIINNFYFKNKIREKEIFLEYFFKIQKVYHTLIRFCFKYKFKKSKIIVDTDLQLNNIKHNDKNVICIYHINSRYLFKINELLKIIYTSLTNNYSFFIEPICIKNPYNNIPFNKSILYYIYYYLSNNTKICFLKNDHLDLFLKFKECNFNMTKFVNNYEYILREYAIKNYITHSTRQVMKKDILNIIDTYNSDKYKDRNKILISKEFPDEQLILIFKPYLYLKLISKYSLILKNKNEALEKLQKKLYEFQKYNPLFGRKKYIFKNKIKNGKLKHIISHVEFNMNYKKFNTYDINNFMKNHLAYKYETSYNNNEYNDNLNNTYLVFNMNILSLNNNQTMNNITEEYFEEESEEESEEELEEELEEESYNTQIEESEESEEEYENESIS